jgi:hypothetical protein
MGVMVEAVVPTALYDCPQTKFWPLMWASNGMVTFWVEATGDVLQAAKTAAVARRERVVSVFMMRKF